MGAVLSQPHPDGGKVIAFISRSLTKNEQHFTVTERECLALLWTIERLRPYIKVIKFTVITDHHSLLWLSNIKDPRGRLARWAVALQQYEFRIVHRKGREHHVPDCLSRSVPVLDCVAEYGVIQLDRWYSRQINRVRKYPDKYNTWRVEGNMIYKYIECKYPELSDPNAHSWKRVVPKSQRRKLIHLFHDTPTSGDLGIYITFHKLADKYYWPKMRCDVTRYVNGCKICCHFIMRFILLQKLPAGFMVSRTHVTRTWELISADLVGPLPKSLHGNLYIFVCLD